MQYKIIFPKNNTTFNGLLFYIVIVYLRAFYILEYTTSHFILHFLNFGPYLRNHKVNLLSL